MHAVDGVHILATLTIGLVLARGLQAMTEWFFPGSDAVAVMRFLYGGT